MKKIFIILVLFLFLFSPGKNVQAFFSCENYENNSSKTLKNDALESFLEKQTQLFFEAQKEVQTQEKQCFKKEQVNNLWKNIQRNSSFGINQFIFSFSSFYDNSCRQKDTFKLLAQIDSFEKIILQSIQDCKTPNEMIKVIQASVSMLQYIRDHDTDMDNTIVSPEINRPFSDYWAKDLYTKGSQACPSESWHEVEKSWCKLQNNINTLKNISSEISVNDKDIKKTEAEKKKRKAIAKAEAKAYLNANLPSFLTIKSKDTVKAKSHAFKNFLSKIFAPIINSFQDLTSSDFDSRSLQNTQVLPQRKNKDTIKLLEVGHMLSDISDKYGKNYEAQVYLEKEIHALKNSVNHMRKENNPVRNLNDFINTLKKTESISPRSCNVTLK